MQQLACIKLKLRVNIGMSLETNKALIMQLAIALMLSHLLSPIVYLHLGDASLAKVIGFHLRDDKVESF